MRMRVGTAQACVAALLCGAVLTGCGYEHNPVRVHWNIPEPSSKETFLTYGLRISPPWPEGGYLLLSTPERIQCGPEGKALFSYDDLAFTLPCPQCGEATLFTGPAGSKTVRCTKCAAELRVLDSYGRRDVWEIAPDERTAVLDIESPSTPGVHLRIELKVAGPRLDFALAVRNDSGKDLDDITARFGYDWKELKGTWKPMRDLGTLPADRAPAVLSEASGTRKALISWQPGEPVSFEGGTSKIYIRARIGEVGAGKSAEATGVIIFSEGPVEQLLKEALKPGR